MLCTTCSSKGFAKSVVPNRCTFCDGTEGGNPPLITGVAVRVTVRGFCETHVLSKPNRHHNILHNLKLSNKAAVEEGFILEDLTFMTREEAFVLASSNGQLKRREGSQFYQGPKLFSEDLW